MKKRSAKKKPVSKKHRKAGKNIPEPLPNFWRRHWLPGLIIFLLPFLLYFSSLSFGYVLDDQIVLSENKFVQKGFGGIWEIFTTESFVGYFGEQRDLVAGARYRPLSIVNFAVEYQFWGLNPRISHFFNILFYGFTGLLLFRFLAFILPKFSDKWWLGLPFIASTLFLLHPIHTEVVANIKGRDEILALLLSLSTLYFAYRYLRRSQLIYLVLAGLVFFLSLLAKENSLTYMAVIPLTLFLFGSARLKELLLVALPLALATGAYLVIRVNVIGYLLDSGKEITSLLNNPFINTSPDERYATIMYTLGQYLKLLFFPHPLTHDYYPYQVPIINWLDWRAWACLSIYLILLYLSFREFKKRPVISWSIWYYLITLSIVSNIVVSVGAPMNERFLYMPSISVCVFLALLSVQMLPNAILKQKTGAYLGLGLLAAICIGFAWKTISRVPAWRNEMTLNRAAVKVSTNSARANSFMGFSLYKLGQEMTDPQEKKKIFEEGLPYAERALEIYPQYKDAINCKAGLITGIYQIDRDLDRLLEVFYELLALQPVDFLDEYMEYLNRREDYGKLIQFYQKAGYQLLALEKRNYPVAVKYLNYGLSIDPNNLPLLENITEVYLLAGQYSQAVQTAQRGFRLQPDEPKWRQLLQEANRGLGG